MGVFLLSSYAMPRKASLTEEVVISLATTFSLMSLDFSWTTGIFAHFAKQKMTREAPCFNNLDNLYQKVTQTNKNYSEENFMGNDDRYKKTLISLF